MIRIFFHFIVMTALFAATAADTFSQVKGKFRVGYDIGFTLSGEVSQIRTGGGNSMNFGYNLQDNMNVGIKFGIYDYYSKDIIPTGSYFSSSSLDIICTHFTGTYTYYFGSNLTPRPFIGGGLGFYSSRYENRDYTNNHTDYFGASNNIGGFLTTGFESSFLRVTAEYHFSSSNVKLTSMSGRPDIDAHIKNNYLGFSFGFFIGGGMRDINAATRAYNKAAKAERKKDRQAERYAAKNDVSSRQGKAAIGINAIYGTGGSYTHFGIGVNLLAYVANRIRFAGEFDYFPKQDILSWWDLSGYWHCILPLADNEKVVLYPLAGIGITGGKAEVDSGIFGVQSASTKGNTVYSLGGGIEFGLSSNLSLNIEMRHKIIYFKEAEIFGKRNNFVAGFAYRF